MEKMMEIAPPRLNPRKRDTVAVLMRPAERRDLPLGEEDVSCLQQAARWLLNKVFQQGRATARKRAEGVEK